MNEPREVSKATGAKIVAGIRQLPTALYHHSIFNYLADKELYHLSQTSLAMYAECEKSLLKRAGKTLLSHVVKGEEEQALQMIRTNPKLLLHASEATDYSGRLYTHYTPFQAALLCHDVRLLKKMGPYFDRLLDGQMEKARQFDAIFPTGISQRTSYNFSDLIQVITHNSSAADIAAALKKTQNDTAICNALNHFRSDFKALAMQETFFNPSHLIRALNVYGEQFNNWSSAQCELFWRQVIGYTQRFLPACLAQDFVQGNYRIVENQQLLPLVRSLKFRYAAGSYYPLLDSSGLGFDLGVYFGGWVPGDWLPLGDAVWLACEALRTYAKQIQQNYVELRAECGVPESPLRTTIR